MPALLRFALPQAPGAVSGDGFVYLLHSLMNINTTLVSFGANHVRFEPATATAAVAACATPLPYGAAAAAWDRH